MLYKEAVYEADWDFASIAVTRASAASRNVEATFYQICEILSEYDTPSMLLIIDELKGNIRVLNQGFSRQFAREMSERYRLGRFRQQTAIENLEGSAARRTRPAVSAEEVAHYLVWPIFIGTKTVGELHLGFTTPSPLESAPDMFINAVSNAFALALERERYLSQPSRQQQSVISSRTRTYDNTKNKYCDESDSSNRTRVSIVQRIGIPGSVFRNPVALEPLLERISTRITSIRPCMSALAIDDALEQIGTALDADRAGVFILGEGEEISSKHVWSKQNPAESFWIVDACSTISRRWIVDKLKNGDVIQISDDDQLPEMTTDDRALWQKRSLKILLGVPLLLDERLRGFITFESTIPQKPWSKEIESILRILANIIIDAFERQQKENEIKETNDLLFTVFNAMGSGAIVTDKNGTILIANSAACQTFRLDNGTTPVGRKLEEITSSASVFMRNTAAREQQQVIVTLRDGAKRNIGFTSVMSESGQRRVIIFRDLTNIIEIGRRQKRTEQLARIGMMVAKLGHEIKNPLTSILLGLRSLEANTYLRSDDNFILQSVLEEVRLTKTLMNDFLESMRLQEVSPMYMRIEPIVVDCLETKYHLAPRRGIALQNVMGPAETYLCVDRNAMVRALGNLVQNAIEACQEGNTVCVGWRLLSNEEKAIRIPGYHRDVVCLFVEDDGPGIPPKVMQNLFVPFTSTKSKGSGLGLSIVKEIVDGHGGVIDIKNGIVEKERGARFEILLASGERPSCRDVHSGCGPTARPTCPVPESCPVDEAKCYYTCWIQKGKATMQETGKWNEECLGCEVFLDGNLEPYFRRSP